MNGSEKTSAKSSLSDGHAPVHRASFSLGTTAKDLDPRIHAIRGDIADIALADRIALPHYVAPVSRSVRVALTDLRMEPDEGSELGSQLLFGEGFAWLDTVDDWAWGYCEHDHYVGFVRKDALGPPADPTHVVTSVSAELTGNPAVGTLYMGSQIAGELDGDAITTSVGTIPLSSVAPTKNHTDDPAAIAEMFVGSPYLLGGRSSAGIDCSGLVQIALAMAGHQVQRDSDLQQATIGQQLPADADLQRSDLVFFPDHVGMMLDNDRLIHASGDAGAVTVEPLEVVADRIAQQHDTAILARRRPIS